MKADASFDCQWQGYRLSTAEIIYHLPDYPKLLQSYIWQDYDLAPRYPVLTKFLDFWARELDGVLHSVRVAERDIISASDVVSATHFSVH